MATFRTLFKAGEASADLGGNLYIGTVVGFDINAAAVKATEAFGIYYTLIGIAADTASSNGHGRVLKVVVPVKVPAVTVNGNLSVSDI